MRKKLIFSGNVQGVGFRAISRHAARKFHVQGWVRNNSDGTVTLVLEGNGKQIGIVINYLKNFFQENIDKMIQIQEKEEGLQSFEIRK